MAAKGKVGVGGLGARRFDELRARGLVTVCLFFVGWVAAWSFKVPLVLWAVAPFRTWEVTGTPPYSPFASHFLTFVHAATATATLVALPLLALQVWGLLAPRSLPQALRARAAFLLLSYLAVALGSWFTRALLLPSLWTPPERVSLWQESLLIGDAAHVLANVSLAVSVLAQAAIVLFLVTRASAATRGQP